MMAASLCGGVDRATGERGDGRGGRARSISGRSRGAFADLQPLWKYSWPNGDQVYVSENTGEVVQYTTTASRLGAYVGAIPHWLYFTPLRKHGLEWSRIVIWSSGIGTVSAILGIVIGVWMYSPSKRYRYAGAPTSIPYRGQKRWHTIFGLIFGLGAATWAFSGMLSMDPFPTRRTGGPAGGGGARRRSGIPQALRGRVPLAAFAAKHPREALAQLADLEVKELELTSFAGEPVYLATSGRRRHAHRSGRRRTARRSSTASGSSTSSRRRRQPDGGARGQRARSVRSVLPRSTPGAPAAGHPGAAERCGAHALLHRSEDGAGRRQLQLAQLDEPVALPRAALARLSRGSTITARCGTSS